MTSIAEKLNLSVGGEAYVSDAYNRLKRAKVTKITPSGQVVVEIPTASSPVVYRFNSRGHELSPSSKWRTADLISKDDYDRGIASQKRDNARKLLQTRIDGLSGRPVMDPGTPEVLEALAKEIRAFQAEVS